MSRMVRLDTGWQTVSAVQDLIEGLLDTDQAGFLHRVEVYQSSEEGSAEDEKLQISIKRASGSYTSGSGGSSATVTVDGPAAHSMAGTERNNTSQAAAGTGSLDTVKPGAINVLAGEWEASWETVSERPPLGPSQAVVVSLDEAPADAITMRCMVTIELTHG